MKIFTPEALDDFLDDSFAWRRQELILIKSLVEKNRNTPRKLKCYLRSGVTILYAHWEGFIKEASLAYLNFVSMQRLRYDELATNFVAFALKSKLDEASRTNKAIIHTKVVKFFLFELSQRSYIPRSSDAIDTESNLKSEVFKNIVHSLGLEYLPKYELQEKFIDLRLLKTRNEVAHGEFSNVKFDEFIELFDRIIDLIETFRNQISNAAAMKSYKRT